MKVGDNQTLSFLSKSALVLFALFFSGAAMPAPFGN
jgi:hypothetical protein